MENKKALSADQLNNLKETVRQRFDELYNRIGKNRQNLFNKVLFEHQHINKELTKETVDDDHEKDILRRVREIERSADSQLPHIHKMVHPTGAPAIATTPVVAPKPPKTEKRIKSEKESKPSEPKPKAKAKPKPEPKAKSKSESKGMAKAKAAKKKKK
jgi:hypothetical protein